MGGTHTARTVTLGGCSQDALHALVDRLWTEAKTFASQAPTFKSYRSTWEKLYETVTVATLIEHPAVGAMVDQWDYLQENALAQIRKEIEPTKRKLAEDKEIHDQYIRDNAAAQKEYGVLWQTMRAQSSPSETNLRRLTELQSKAKEYEENTGEAKKLEDIIKFLDSALGELDRIEALPKEQRVTYLLLFPDEIAQAMKKGTYRGMVHSPLDIQKGVVEIINSPSTAGGELVQEQARPVTSAALVLSELPLELRALVQLRDEVAKLVNGSKFQPGDIRRKLPDDYVYSADIIGSWLRGAGNLFGVRRIGETYRLEMVGSAQMNDGLFIGGVMDKIETLRRVDLAAINRHYIQKVLDGIRKDPSYAFEVFSDQAVIDGLAREGYRWISLRGLRGVLRRQAEVYGITPRDDLRQGESQFYVFNSVTVSDEQAKIISEVAESFGFDQFDLEGLVTKVGKTKPNFSKGLIQRVIENPLSGYTKSERSGVVYYQKAERPASAREQLSRSANHPDMTSLA